MTQIICTPYKHSFILVAVLDCHHIVGLKVGVRDLHEVTDVVLAEVHHVPVHSPDVAGATVAQGEGSRTDSALVRLGSGVGLPVSPEKRKFYVKCFCYLKRWNLYLRSHF